MSMSFTMTAPTRVQLMELAFQFQGALSFALVVMMILSVLGLIEFKDRCPAMAYSRCHFVSDCRSFLCSIIGIVISRAIDSSLAVGRQPCIGNWQWFERFMSFVHTVL
mmetsp:Transcript_79408/g.220985  ORF Transcript_79408/g.220985 Transcript_79408/m.220985 type:complete len:108 (-) Transcript_79408:190-513(-)